MLDKSIALISAASILLIFVIGVCAALYAWRGPIEEDEVISE